MTRLVGLIVYNWPLKVMAVALAVLLYAGLIVTQNAQSKDVSVPIQAINYPQNTILVGSLGEISQIRYFVTNQTDVSVTNANFTASVDLAQVQPGTNAQSVPVQVLSADPRIRVISASPAFVSVKLEKVKPRDVPVVILPGPPPTGLTVKPPVASIKTATVLGAESDVARVATVQALVAIDASGIDIDRDIPLTPVDQLGEPVLNVDVQPTTVHVTMEVIKDQKTASVPIALDVIGNPAPGFEVIRATADTAVLAISGDAANLADVATAQTQPISIEGRTSDLETTVGFALPQGVDAVTPTTVTVHVVIRPVTQSRTFTAGITVVGARADRTYALSIQEALVTVGGAPADLDQLSGAQLVLTAQAGDLEVGDHQVTLTISLPQGLSVVAISPPTVTVTVAAAASAVPASTSP